MNYNLNAYLGSKPKPCTSGPSPALLRNSFPRCAPRACTPSNCQNRRLWTNEVTPNFQNSSC